ALFAAMILLGGGDRAVGYPLPLAVICQTGVVQIVPATLKLARFAAIFPALLVAGVLASIGLLIIAKQRALIVERDAIHHKNRAKTGRAMVKSVFRRDILIFRLFNHLRQRPLGKSSNRVREIAWWPYIVYRVFNIADTSHRIPLS